MEDWCSSEVEDRHSRPLRRRDCKTRRTGRACIPRDILDSSWPSRRCSAIRSRDWAYLGPWRPSGSTSTRSTFRKAIVAPNPRPWPWPFGEATTITKKSLVEDVRKINTMSNSPSNRRSTEAESRVEETHLERNSEDPGPHSTALLKKTSSYKDRPQTPVDKRSQTVYESKEILRK